MRKLKIELEIQLPSSEEKADDATHCNTLQHTATHWNTLQHTAIHCNTLQHAATRCNTLQHTAATHCLVFSCLNISSSIFSLPVFDSTVLTERKTHMLKRDANQERHETPSESQAQYSASSILDSFLLLSWAEIANTIANTTVKNNITYRPTEFLGFANMVVEKNKSTSWIESWV